MGKQMTIESHYQALMDARDKLAARIDNLDGSVAYSRQNAMCICARATKLAADAWQETRMEYAAKRAPMPDGPAVFGESGYEWRSGVHANRSPHLASEMAFITRAHRELRAELQQQLELASERFDRYAALVAQGVALPPSAE